MSQTKAATPSLQEFDVDALIDHLQPKVQSDQTGTEQSLRKWLDEFQDIVKGGDLGFVPWQANIMTACQIAVNRAGLTRNQADYVTCNVNAALHHQLA